MAVCNNVNIIGRITRDIEIRYSQGENANAYATINVAVNRDYKNADGGYDADFINVSLIGKTAEFVEKYFAKGDAIAVQGSIRTGSYTNSEGQKIYTTNVHADKVGFVPGASKKSGNNSTSDFVESTPTEDEELPFN